MTQLAEKPGGVVRVHRATGRAPSGRRRHHLTSTHGRIAWTFVTPFMIIFVLFTLIPAFMALGFSFTDIKASDVRNPFGVGFVYFDTFVKVLGNAGFQRSALNTLIYVVIGVPVTMVIAFLLALVLDAGIRRLKGLFRALIYVPVIANVVAAAVIWQYAFTNQGPINSALSTLGITGPNWLSQPGTAVFVVLLLCIWRNIGTCMVLFLAGLQAVPEEVHEAASLDGAGYWRRVASMTVPLLQPTTLLVSVLMTVNFLNMFDEPFLVTNGGPLNSTRSIAQWVYEQFGYGNIAGSMAGSWVLLVIVLIIAFLQIRFLRSKA
ncbi:carbohydrate ABC transporter permease [Subtercola frigoramans]|uniref:Multiple sugar transport system permease protein n=1 Tax=Subtercola frigoramans TaxID=120298 RepID=A0ABS2L224_9MICO|nr:sugar ABC transporter permease [Subtercola frigoramans]MBM7471117.1 multiple sugar transport system permease protein [Subtercola frigoramans]